MLSLKKKAEPRAALWNKATLERTRGRYHLANAGLERDAWNRRLSRLSEQQPVLSKKTAL